MNPEYEQYLTQFQQQQPNLDPLLPPVNPDTFSLTDRNLISHRIVQDLIEYARPMSGTNRDDSVYVWLNDLHAEIGLPCDLTPDELYHLYQSNYGGGP